MYKDYADGALKFLKEKKVDYGEVRLEEHDTSGVLLKNGTPELSGFDTSVGMGIRFLLKGGLGFVSINDFNKKKIEENISKALKLVKRGIKLSEKTGLSEERAHKKKYKVEQKIKIKDVGVDQQLKLLQEVDNGVKKAIGRYMSLSLDLTKKYFINTENTKIESEIPRPYFISLLTLKEGERSNQKLTQFCNSGGYEFVKKWNLVDVLSEQVRVLKNNLKKAKKMPGGEVDVVAGSKMAGIMVHEACGHPVEADRILGREAAQAGESFVHKDMIGKVIGNKKVTIVEDPRLENSAGYYLYDDEGVKARRRYLYKNGKINEFLHNRETAFELGVKSNGAARAENFDKETMVRMTNTFLLPGDFKDEELVKGVKKGVYMKDFTEWNIDDKRFQMKFVGSECYLIEKGEIKEPIWSPALEITTPKLWGSVDAIGKKIELDSAICGKGEPMQGVPVWLGGPHFRLRGIKIG
ncbi:MAG: hypothetical protein CMH63_00285 [Nanoarchaeota archaeon]|jgi:TldD protein|nr:hypothetical protein [Nanoarchaeota archaeon]|tara:strand:- start:18895 stop:20295 length:1401 start_codon:yes stop_codon:yes gene_type:complete